MSAAVETLADFGTGEQCHGALVLWCPLGPLGFECSQHRQTLRPSSSRDPQQSPASFRSAVKDLEDHFGAHQILPGTATFKTQSKVVAQ